MVVILSHNEVVKIFWLILIFPWFSEAQNQTYVSGVDEGLTIRKVMVVPFLDNVSGIYASHVTQHLESMVSKNRQWTLVTAQTGPFAIPEDYAENPRLSAALLKKAQVDAFWTGRLSKGPKGLSLKLTLIGGKDALPLVSNSFENFSGFEVEDVKSETRRLYESMLAAMPYQGEILSRQGTVTTVNLSRYHNVREGDEILAVLITRVERHPKFNFIVRSSREVMGRLKIFKTDDAISFAHVLEERTAGLIRPGMKLTLDRPVRYPDLGQTADGKPVPQLAQVSDQQLSFGEKPRESFHVPRATFGRVDLSAGLSATNLSTTHSDGASAESANALTPSVVLAGEMWLDPRWQLNLDLHQLTSRLPNGRDGSTPATLNTQVQQFTLTMGYNFLTEESFFGPKLQAQIGFTSASIFVQDSAPRAHTSKSYSGFALAAGGSLPLVTETDRYVFGGRFVFHLLPSVADTPNTSGSGSAQIAQFSLFAEKTLTPKLYARATFLFEQLSSNYSGGLVTSSSINLGTIVGGIGYQF